MELKQELEDFLWWEKNISYRVSSIANREFRLVICSDTSLSGWGIACGKKELMDTGKNWRNHIILII